MEKLNSLSFTFNQVQINEDGEFIIITPMQCKITELKFDREFLKDIKN